MPSFTKEPFTWNVDACIIKREKLSPGTVQNETETRKDCVFIYLDGKPIYLLLFWKKFLFDEQIYSVSR